MSKAITVRLDESDHELLARQAKELQMAPGTLARLLLHTGLNQGALKAGRSAADGSTGSTPDDAGVQPLDRQAALAALDRLVERSSSVSHHDVVKLLDESRASLDPSR